MYRKFLANPDFDKSISVDIQTCVHCLGFRGTQLSAFISRNIYLEMVWEISLEIFGLKNSTWTCSLKVNKYEGYKLSHKMTKNTFMALFLKTGLLQT